MSLTLELIDQQVELLDKYLKLDIIFSFEKAYFIKDGFCLIYLFLTVLVLSCCMGFSLVVVSGGYSLAVIYSLLIAVASLIGEQRL